MPDFHGMIPYEQGPQGGNVVSAERQMTADTLWALTAAASWVFAYLLGGLVAGRAARSSPGINGALVAVCGAFFGVISAVLALGPINLLNDPENGGPLFVGFVAFAILFPITVLASYLGGRLGGLFIRR